MYVPAIKASLSVTASTTIMTTDRRHPAGDYRIIVLDIGDLSLHIGIHDDAEVVTVCDRLIEPLHELREAALRRLAEPLPTADDVLGILKEQAPV